MPLIKFNPAFSYQVNYLLLCIAWNVAGVILIRNGEPALGPTASLVTVGILAGFIVLLFLGAWRWPKFYAVVTVVLMLVAYKAVIPAFTQDPALWPSELWRLGGAVLNGLGAAVSMWGLLLWWRWYKKQAEIEAEADAG